MDYVIDEAPSVGTIPAAVREHLCDRVKEVVIALETLARPSALLTSVADSDLVLQVDGWRFTYQIWPEAKLVRIVNASSMAAKETRSSSGDGLLAR